MTLSPSLSPALSTALLFLPILAPFMYVPLVLVSVTSHWPCSMACVQKGRRRTTINSLRSWTLNKRQKECTTVENYSRTLTRQHRQDRCLQLVPMLLLLVMLDSNKDNFFTSPSSAA